MTPQTIHILVYKNAIANKLRTTQKLPIQNVEQFDNMIKHNNNPMNNNFWHLFTQLISQLAQIHKKTNIAITEWEQHFDKLQHGLTFDENNPDVTDTSENENCNKKIIQNDTGPSQNKSHDKHKTHSLDGFAENMVKELRAVPRHLNIDNKKTLDVQLNLQKFPHETFNTAVLRSLTPYQQLMLNRLAGGRVVVLGGKECQKSKGETGLLSNNRNGKNVQ